jgi:DnaJ-class molecular chaperone
LTFKGKGHQNPSKENGDLLFVIKELPHSFIRRDNLDLYYTLDMKLVDAIQSKPIEIVFF